MTLPRSLISDTDVSPFLAHKTGVLWIFWLIRRQSSCRRVSERVDRCVILDAVTKRL